MDLWEGELTTVGIWSWWFLVTAATVGFGVRGWRGGAPGGRWAALAGLLGLATGLAPWATGLSLFLAGWTESEFNDAMNVAAYRVAPFLWAASQLAVVAAVATAWREGDRTAAAAADSEPTEPGAADADG